jgi:tetratricopeptide (TPR) repeat protein
LLSNAWTGLGTYDVTNQGIYAKRAVNDAMKLTKDYPKLGAAWYLLGHAEHKLKNDGRAVEAFLTVAETDEYFFEARNTAAAIYFEVFDDYEKASHLLEQAIKRAPNDLTVLANYAELLLAQGDNTRAKDTAAQVHKHADAQLPGQAHVRAAMSFVEFVAELLSGNQGKALARLNEIASQVNTSAKEAAEAETSGERPAMWEYRGIRGSLQKRSEITPRDQLLKVLNFVETNGKAGTLDDMSRWLKAQHGKE